MGKAMMGTGEAEGDGRAMKATEMAIIIQMMIYKKVQKVY